MQIPLIISDGSSVDGVSLGTLWQRLAKTLGYFTTGTVTTVASGFEAKRWVISEAMQSDEAPPDELDRLYLTVTGGAQANTVHRLVRGTLDGPNGALYVDGSYSAPLEEGTPFAVSVLPRTRCQGAGDLVEAINWTLETLPLFDDVEIDADDDTTDYLLDYPWTIRRVEAVSYPRSSSSERLRWRPRDWSFDLDAESPMLRLRISYSSGQEFSVRLRRTANTRIEQSGVWGDSSTGLVNDSDRCLYDARTVVTMARPEALRRYARLFPRGSDERAELEGEALVEEQRAMLTRFHAGFRGNGAQSAGAV